MNIQIHMFRRLWGIWDIRETKQNNKCFETYIILCKEVCGHMNNYVEDKLGLVLSIGSISALIILIEAKFG